MAFYESMLELAKVKAGDKHGNLSFLPGGMRNLNALPTIENDVIKFERNYFYPKGENSLDFETILCIKESGKEIRNTVRLFPIRKKRLQELLQQAGFGDIRFYGDFPQ